MKIKIKINEAREQSQLKEQVEDEQTLMALAMQALQRLTPDQLGDVIEMAPPPRFPKLFAATRESI